MPGAFHTELLVRSASEVDIFLLDVAWKNPTTQKSSVVVELKIGAETASLKCVTLEDRFRCGVNDGVVIAPGGQIEIAAMRAGVAGGLAKYRFPLMEFKDGRNKRVGR